MKAFFYKIKCITNLHMGSGDINFNIIDNEVQRDTITGLPTMFSSGVKGALREHFKNNENIVNIFGSDIKTGDSDGNSKSTPGKLKFLSSNLLFLPVRASKGNQPYYLVSTKSMLTEFENLYQTIIGKEFLSSCLLNKLDDSKTYGSVDAQVDGIKTSNLKMDNSLYNLLKKEFGNNLLIINNVNMRKITLPVLARNQLDNGISQNLWYEEVVPHEAIFYTAVLSDGTRSGDKALDDFDNYITNNNLVQFGGNASIGYGLTQMTKIDVTTTEK